MTALDLGQYVTFILNQKGDSVTHKKLQKLLYYIQAWHLVHLGYPILEEDFQAWVHGPVLPSLYQDLKGSGINDIAIINDEFEGGNHAIRTIIEKNQLTEDQISLIDSVLLNYAGLTAFQLEILSHSEAPWLEARKGLPPHAPCTSTIKKERILQFYTNLLKSQNGEEG